MTFTSYDKMVAVFDSAWHDDGKIRARFRLTAANEPRQLANDPR